MTLLICAVVAYAAFLFDDMIGSQLSKVADAPATGSAVWADTDPLDT